MKSNLSIFFKGMIMGVTELIPGVSGGTIALILGIYERLIRAISNINFTTRKTDFFEIIIDIEVRDVSHLNNIIAALRLVSEISSLIRVKG